MPAVDTLLILLIEDTRNIAARMAAAGYSEDETRGASNCARKPGYTEATGLGQDRLTTMVVHERADFASATRPTRSGQGHCFGALSHFALMRCKGS